jgi:hypothetical protein
MNRSRRANHVYEDGGENDEAQESSWPLTGHAPNSKKMKVYDYIQDMSQLHIPKQMFWSKSPSCT